MCPKVLSIQEAIKKHIGQSVMGGYWLKSFLLKTFQELFPAFADDVKDIHIGKRCLYIEVTSSLLTYHLRSYQRAILDHFRKEVTNAGLTLPELQDLVLYS